MIKLCFQDFKYPPVINIPTKMPKYLIYHEHVGYRFHNFKMCSATKPHKLCEMACFSDYCCFNEKIYPSLFVSYIESKPRKSGMGTKMLDFAQIVSKRLDCDGKFHLSADAQFTKDEAPHIFYRKYGMGTEDEEVNKKLDEKIQAGENGTIDEFRHIKMYYPPVPTKKRVLQKKEDNFFERLRVRLLNWFES